MADKKGGRVRGGFLVITGFISIGIGASIYYGELGVGSLTKNNNVQHTGSTWAYLPVGFGIVLLVAGLALAIVDRRTG
jgi:hypothetical protein